MERTGHVGGTAEYWNGNEETIINNFKFAGNSLRFSFTEISFDCCFAGVFFSLTKKIINTEITRGANANKKTFLYPKNGKKEQSKNCS